MRIAYFTESLYPHVDGVSRTLARLFATLEERGEEFRVFSPFLPDDSVSWSGRVHGVRFAHVPTRPEYRVSMPGSRAVREELERFRPDLVHVVSPTPMAVWAQRWARRAGVPVVASFHTHFVSYFRYYGARPLERFGWRALRWFYDRCDRVYAPSYSIIRELEAEGIGGVDLWSRGMDLAAFSPSFRDETLRARVGADEETPLLLLVSRLVKEKDLADLVAMNDLLERRQVRFQLALVGEGPMREELERTLPRAHFAGHQGGEALARWYASADVFVFPSTTETLGNVVLEALASGVPAVVTDRGGPQDLIREGETGFIVPANRPQELAERVERLLRDPLLRRHMGAAAHDSAASRDWSEINGALVESYEKVIADRFHD
ncbi:MAG TPA: glycosyltransferase family 1 protein [Longimicrobiaceae bacterium]|nr:glycosyltransferase family 1 protein [Longimicrobiaceae bacterium]